jgi:hypothetical protein
MTLAIKRLLKARGGMPCAGTSLSQDQRVVIP